MSWDDDIRNRSTTETSHLLQQRNIPNNEYDLNNENPRWIEPFWGKLLWGCVGVVAGVLLMHVATTTTQKKYPTKEMTAMMFGTTRKVGSAGTARGGGAAAAAPGSTIPSSLLSSSPYSKFQPLTFQIYTGGAPGFIIEEDEEGNNQRRIENPECEHFNSYGHLDGEILCYMGHSNTNLDVEQRLAIMTDAVERAYELSDKDSDTLKVFVAPEFFWRGKDGAYVYTTDNNNYTDTDECREICQILSGLETLVAQKRFEDWLFAFGTVIAAEILPKADVWDYLFYNFAPVYKGYDPSQTDYHAKRFIVPKRYVSNIDFLTPRRHFNDSLAKELIQFGPPSDKTVLNPYDIQQKKYDRIMWHKYKEELDTLGYTMIEYDWFILDGITFSIEVCLDHDLKTALNTVLADAVKGSPTRIPRATTKGSGHSGIIEYVPIPTHQAQISIVSSSGMTVNVDSMALASGGTIILQDGLDDQEAGMTWEDECQQFSWHFAGGSEAIQRFSVVSPTEVLFEYEVTKTYDNHYLYYDTTEWKDHLYGIFTTEKYAPKVTVYKSSDITQV